MTAIDTLRCIVVTVWSIFLIFQGGPVWRVLAGSARHDDVLWALLGGVSLLILGFNILNLVGAVSDATRAGLHVFSILLGCGFIVAVRAYQETRHG